MKTIKMIVRDIIEHLVLLAVIGMTVWLLFDAMAKISHAEEIYSWTDDSCVRHFSNVNTPAGADVKINTPHPSPLPQGEREFLAKGNDYRPGYLAMVDDARELIRQNEIDIAQKKLAKIIAEEKRADDERFDRLITAIENSGGGPVAVVGSLLPVDYRQRHGQPCLLHKQALLSPFAKGEFRRAGGHGRNNVHGQYARHHGGRGGNR